jgi:hypothetical protein
MTATTIVLQSMLWVVMVVEDVHEISYEDFVEISVEIVDNVLNRSITNENDVQIWK